MKGRKAPLSERLWEYIAPAAWDECWLWTGRLNRDGYGQIGAGGAGGRMLRAHRAVYELLVAEIPPGMQLDHLCRVRHCVNPWHMDVVTLRVNVQRGRAGVAAAERLLARTHCRSGHPFDEANTLRDYRGNRKCRECQRRNSLAAYYRKTSA